MVTNQQTSVADMASEVSSPSPPTVTLAHLGLVDAAEDWADGLRPACVCPADS